MQCILYRYVLVDLTRCDWGGLAQDVLDLFLQGYEQGIPLLQTKANKEGVNCPRSGPLSSLVAGRLASFAFATGYSSYDHVAAANMGV